ncbi:MAG TPA: DUF362 domain-containing protein [Spirochaetota bacterium]|nr:DUF362 domain-containing protein [Spirochaetota bacterium]
MKEATVSIQKCSSYNPEDVFRAVKNSLDDINFRIKDGSSVLLKPNILAQYRPEQCATTHPEVVDAVCRIFREHDCRITIGESLSYYQGGGTGRGFITSGIADVAEKYGAELLPFEATRLKKIETGKELKPFYITEALSGHDLVVNIPKMKIHRLARYTGAVKNTYGCIPGGTKQLYHKLFQDRPDYQEFWGIPLADVYESVNPGLNIMDAVYGLDVDGPAANGRPKFTGLILTSENGAALDVTACRIMGFDPQWVPAVRECIKRGFVVPEEIPVKGDIPQVRYIKLPDKSPSAGILKKIDDYMFDQLFVEPRINFKKCSKCGDCINGCAVSAIKKGNSGFPEIKDDECIRCYCCSEYCPDGAIYLHGSIVNLIIRGIRNIIKI